jgi:hypothetical protein
MNIKGNASFAKLLLKSLVPVLSNLIEKDQLKCIKELKNSARGSCMTSNEKKSQDQVKKMQYLYSSFA